MKKIALGRAWLLPCLVACLASSPYRARAHGGLPISEFIIFKGDTMYVPTMFWGVFYGTDGGPWRWICEEAINRKQDRKWALQGDGTYHVTDYSGITSSRDGGCTWVSSTGDIAARSTSGVLGDPADPKRAWATTDQFKLQNALYTTVDGGLHWTASLTADEFLYGPAISADGQRIYVIGTSPGGGAAPATLHVSKNGGQAWTAASLTYGLNGSTPSIVPLLVDQNDMETLYARANGDPTAVLLRISSDGKTVTELLKADGTMLQSGIGGIAFSEDGKTLYAGAKNGLYRSVGGAPMTKISNLDQAQCVAGHNGKLYSCSWNYAPDNAAIARSDDGGQTFKKIFQYADTLAPTESCGASTPVGKICPQVWQTYCASLGIPSCLGGGVSNADGGGAPIMPGASCAVSAQSPSVTAKASALAPGALP